MPWWRAILTVMNLAGMRFGGAIVGLLTQILLTHLLSETDVGTVLLAMSAASLISLSGTLGYPALTLTSTARYVALGRKRLLAAFKTIMVRDTAVAGLLATVIALAVARFAPVSEAMAAAIVVGCLSAPFAAMLRMNSALANSERRFTLSYAPDFLFRPGLFALYLIAHWAFSGSLSRFDVLAVFVAVLAGVAVVQALLLGPRGILPPYAPFNARLARPLRRRAVALAIVFAVSSAFGDLVTLLGGLYLPADEVAVLGLAVRLAALAGFVTQAAQQMVLPDLALVMARQPRADVNRLLLKVNLISLSAIIACVLGAIVLGRFGLGLFGAPYIAGHLALVTLMLSQAFRAASGLNQHLMSITGFQAKTAISCIFSAAVLVAGVSLLAPRYGVNGAAIAVLVADAVWALLLAIQAGRYAGYRGDIVGLLRAR